MNAYPVATGGQPVTFAATNGASTNGSTANGYGQRNRPCS